ncbi:MAG: FAD-dependent oxidoreductase [Sulfolobales archaeon]
MRVAIIGAGPAGLSLARYLVDHGFSKEVQVFEAQRDLAIKPCGWGLPDISRDSEISDITKIALKHVLWEYSGYRVYIDGELLFENKSRRVLGYIINKRDFLRSLSEGVELKLNTTARYLGEGKVLIRNREVVKYDIVVNAGGFYSQKISIEKIPAIQYYIEGKFSEPEIPELYFNSRLVGYAWFFPENSRRARLGIGGYASVNDLENMLREVIILREELRRASIIKREGALVTVGGVVEELAKEKDPYHIGEALGAVMPATGEGIRPSIYTALALYRSIRYGTDYLDELRKIYLYKAIELQRKILELEIITNPSDRKRFLMKTPEELLIKISLGYVSKTDLLKLSIRPETLRLLLNLL